MSIFTDEADEARKNKKGYSGILDANLDEVLENVQPESLKANASMASTATKTPQAADMSLKEALERAEAAMAKTPIGKQDLFREKIALKARHAIIKELMTADKDVMYREVKELQALYKGMSPPKETLFSPPKGGDVAIVQHKADVWKVHTTNMFSKYEKSKMRWIFKFIDLAVAYADHAAEILASLVVQGVFLFEDMEHFIDPSQAHRTRVNKLIERIFLSGKRVEQVVAALDVIVVSYDMLHAVMVADKVFT